MENTANEVKIGNSSLERTELVTLIAESSSLENKQSFNFDRELYRAYLKLSNIAYKSDGIDVEDIKKNSNLYSVLLSNKLFDAATLGASFSETYRTLKKDHINLVSLIENNERERVKNKLKDTIELISNYSNKQIINAIIEFSGMNDIDNKEVKNSDNIKELKDAWGGMVGSFISGIMKLYDQLYGPGYQLIAPGGILTNTGVFKLTENGDIQSNGDKNTTALVYGAIKTAFSIGDGRYSNFEKYISDSELNYKIINNCKNGVCLSKFHLENMYGYINSSESLKEYANGYNTKNKDAIENGSKTPIEGKIKKYSLIRSWIEKRIEDNIYKIYYEAGITKDSDTLIVNELNSEIAKSLKQIIVVSEYTPNVAIKLKILANGILNPNMLYSKLNSIINNGVVNAKISTRSIADGLMLEVTVIYNEKAYNGDVLYAHQILDDLEAQQTVVGWDNVLLGKNLDNELFTMNFMNDKIPQIALYATSGAGKGVTTLTLLASAIASKCLILYLDAKPDMSICLGNLAWKNGKEAFVFNGAEAKGVSLESSNHGCTRQLHRFYDAQSIPTGLFYSAQSKESFMMLVTYIRGIELICDLALERSKKQYDSSIPWMVCVLDELQIASFNEATIMRDVINPKQPTAKQLKNPSELDEVSLYVHDFKKWVNSVVAKFAGCIRATFRQAKLTMIYVWQDSTFPKSKDYDGSAIAKCIWDGRGNIYKIVGKGFAVNSGSTEFGTPSSLRDSKWYDSKFSGSHGGYFALGQNVTSDNMTVFRPFNVYPNTDGKDLIISAANASGLKPDDLLGVSLYKDEYGEYGVIPEVGFEGYTNRLLKKYGITAAEQLDTSFHYCEEFVIEQKGYDNLLSYMYDMHTFKNSDDIDKEYSIEDEIEDNNEANDYGNITDNFEPSNFTTQKVIEDAYNNIKDNNSNLDIDEHIMDLERDIQSLDAEDLENMDEEELENILNATKEVDNAKEIAERNRRQKEDILEEMKRYQNNNQSERKRDLINKIKNSPSFYTEGDNNSYNRVNTEGMNNAFRATSENSINCTNAARSPKGWFKQLYYQTPKGVEKYIDNLFDSILDEVENQGLHRSLISRVTIGVGDLFFNGKRCDLNGIIGGWEGIELKQVISFKKLFKRFKNIQQLVIEAEMLEKAVLEFNDTEYIIDEFFKIEKNLLEVGIKDSSGAVRKIKRTDAVKEMSKRFTNESKERNQLDLAMRTKSTKPNNWNANSENVWGWQLAKGTLGKSSQNLMDAQKPSLFKGLTYGAIGVTVGAIGGAAWLATRPLKLFGSLKNLV